MPQSVAAGEASGAGMSMALSGLMKKNKRALINFQEDFLVPFIERAAWRFMQFDPERYPVQDFNFVPLSTMGMIAREYEQQQMVGLMQTLGPQSPITPILLQGIIQSSSLSNREEIILQLQKMSQPDPQQQQMAQQAMMLDMQMKQTQIQLYDAQAKKAMADAGQSVAETQVIPVEAQAKLAAALSNNINKDNGQREFEQRAKIAELAIKEADVNSNERIAFAQLQYKSQK